ncbi:DUF2164 domain-containing protein [Sinimarinibacterium sp. CAU 1509]|uniref:DUF2164 domain-containing protein n=1 Tax=Sinimarinibacterium sp. CAU 1509 TaxID=2562283 RepID=UPI0010AD02DC|nr:DUF2164 domain-containing protein [Sinimarinibacterium sp. CAU 1509]TJY62957.1 DUF2164 domain-containing protein [Sinimarinibacterium sp. CAU 1509]
MPIEIPKPLRATAVSSIQRYFAENMEEPIGNIAADGLLDYFLQEIGPLVYNQAISDAQTRMQQRAAELDIELHEEPMQYWIKADRGRKSR